MSGLDGCKALIEDEQTISRNLYRGMLVKGHKVVGAGQSLSHTTTTEWERTFKVDRSKENSWVVITDVYRVEVGMDAPGWKKLATPVYTSTQTLVKLENYGYVPATNYKVVSATLTRGM